jgi:thiamine-monophosphate kinase
MTKLTKELGLIRRIRTAEAGRPGAAVRGVVLGIGDDCAILRPPRGHEVLVTTDFSLEGRHFRRNWHTAESAGHRTLARGLSDLAAMGAKPLAAFLSLALPPEMLRSAAGRRWLDGFLAGLRGLAAEFAVPLAGGDTSESPSDGVLADIVLVGSAPAGKALRRSGARAGDGLYVTGWLGGAAAELAMLERGEGRLAKRGRGGKLAVPNPHPQLYPQPRIAAGLALVRRGMASAAMDLSDGLSSDLAHLCRASGVGAEIIGSALPIHPLASKAGEEDALTLALHGGEDYELLFTARTGTRMPRSLGGIPVARIGTVVAGGLLTLVDVDGRRRRLKPGGWEHFAAAK